MQYGKKNRSNAESEQPSPPLFFDTHSLWPQQNSGACAYHHRYIRYSPNHAHISMEDLLLTERSTISVREVDANGIIDAPARRIGDTIFSSLGRGVSLLPLWQQWETPQWSTFLLWHCLLTQRDSCFSPRVPLDENLAFYLLHFLSLFRDVFSRRFFLTSEWCL